MEASIYCPIQMNLKDLVTLKKKEKNRERGRGISFFCFSARARTNTCQLSIPAVLPARGARYLTKSRKITSLANYRFPLINV